MLVSSGVVDFTGRVIGNGVRIWCDGSVDGVTINGSDFRDSISGSDGDDSITGGGGSDTLSGAKGDDTLSGGLGNDRLSLGSSFGSEIALKLAFGGDGDDYFILGYQARGTVDGGAGTDTVELDVSSSHFSDYSSSGIEKIVLVDRHNQYFFTESQLASTQSIDFKFDTPRAVWLGLVGGGTFNLSLIDVGSYGFDARALYSPKGGVTINGSAYSDSLQGNTGADRLIAGDGSDRLYGGGGNDFLNGGNGNDTIYAGRGSDTLSGGAGNDTLYLASRVQGTGVAYGGSGNDAFYIDNALRSTIFGGDGIDTVFGGGDFSAVGVLNAVEVLDTGGYLITLRADQLDDFRSILGHENSDVVSLKIVTGGLLKHWVAIDSSNRLNINASSAAEAIIVTGNNLDDTIIGGLGHDSINGANGSDQLFGRSGNDIISGGAGFDFIVGDAGNDRLSSGTGGGSLHGSYGNDTLEGGSGEDALVGDAGLDLMTGGGGRDKFYFSEVIDSRPFSPDLITDFQAGVDRIMLGDLHSGTGYPGQPSGFKFIGTAAFSAEGQVRYVHQNGDTIVQVNIDGTSGSELSILLKGLVNLSVSDFVLVD
jgi:Ca2+-binding RTX toxin-like protein